MLHFPYDNRGTNQMKVKIKRVVTFVIDETEFSILVTALDAMSERTPENGADADKAQLMKRALLNAYDR